MGGKGKGKGGPPAPPSGDAKAMAELQQKKREQMEREKLEAKEAIARARELEAKMRDLEARVPTLRSHDIAAVPWDAALLSTHLAGGKGTVHGGGVDVVELPGGAAVCVRKGSGIVTESIADALAALLGVRVARMRLVQAECEESRTISQLSRRWSSVNLEKEMERLEKYIEKMEPEAQAKMRAMHFRAHPCAVLEFVPGVSLDTAASSLEAAAPELLADLGQLCALDLVLNNMDRVPLPCWTNAGNLTNAIVTPEGRLIGIDQQVNHIAPGFGLDAYLNDVRDLSSQVLRGSAPSVAMSIREAIKNHCGVELSDASMERVIQNMGDVLRKAALAAREGCLAETLSAAADKAGELTFEYEGYYGHVTPVEPAVVAARDVEFLQKVAAAVADSVGDGA